LVAWNAGLKIIREFSHVVRFNEQLTDENYMTLVKAIQEAGCIVTATPFDERSLEMCVDMGLTRLEITGSQLRRLVVAGKDREDKEAGGVLSGRIVFEAHGRHCGVFCDAEYSAGN
jgi:hypothetical protein